ncbi:energy-coupling factor ABC transporter ATP-binding protein [Desulfosediminicola flagellatus]|uniref:energy-coupling factor ABC transporter ATP-binding protein n=1 Tax=Desulfosediminicola flagellatus TaxID=2569541 RepID=UPI0010ACF581|nr:ABC transporter ATP-binding protein [Desulfosediminicola flagellatus]
MAQIQIDNLSYHYRGAEKPSLHKVSLNISPGECVAIIGANNSGKSTLCYALAGVVPHLYNGTISGRVLIDERENTSRTVSEIARQVGLVLQMPEKQLSGVRYTVAEEIAFGLENQGIPRKQMLVRIQEVLTLMGLQDVAERSPYHLSGGQIQRLALATVLAVDPSILVLDEPTTFLDPQGARQVFETLRVLQLHRRTVVIAEQRLDLIAEYADRVIALDQGRVILDGKPEDVLISPLLQEIGLNWTRYTQVAELAKLHGIWPDGRPLSASRSATIEGLEKTKERCHAN